MKVSDENIHPSQMKDGYDVISVDQMTGVEDCHFARVDGRDVLCGVCCQATGSAVCRCSRVPRGCPRPGWREIGPPTTGSALLGWLHMTAAPHSHLRIKE